MHRRVAFSILGTTLDVGQQDNRWSRWRPTVALCQQDGLFIDRLELLHNTHSQKLAACITADIATVSPATEVRQHLINMDNPWDFAEVYAQLHDFARAYNFDPDREDYLVNITTGTHVAQICWFLLTEARTIPGRLLQLSPPRARNPTKDIRGSHSIIDLDLSIYDSIATRFAEEKRVATSFLKSGIETRNPAFNQLIDRIEKVAIRSKAPVLLSGATGAGKTQLARRIYELKKKERQISGDFIEVNCATLRGDHAMSTLFGHVKGAFTGAQSARSGLMKNADQGMLFLDEIGELGLDEQAMVLRALEEKQFLPLGADKEETADFLLIAGTNRNLYEAVTKGAFREDLLARLNLWNFKLPSLSKRREDIEPNIEYELRKYSEKEGRTITFNAEARHHYLNFALSDEALWRGNFRDLSASLMRMATLSSNGRINLDIVNEEISTLCSIWHGGSLEAIPLALCRKVLGSRMEEYDQFELVQLDYVLNICVKSPSISEAGRRIFKVSRLSKKSSNDADRLRKYLSRFDLRFDDLSDAP